MKIVLDSNVILSAFITQGLSNRVLNICIDKHILFISKWIIDEVLDKLKNKFKIPLKEIKRISTFLESGFHIIEPEGEMPTICRDKDDNNILFLAQYIKADLIITGDKDLLELKSTNKCKIINPRIFMEKFHKIH